MPQCSGNMFWNRHRRPALLVVVLSMAAMHAAGISTSADDLPEPGGAYGPLMFYGPIPLYDPANPPEPGGAFGGSGRESGGGGSSPSKGKPPETRREPPSAARKFKSELAMVTNYSTSGLCLQAAKLSDRCLALVDESISSGDLLQLAQALDGCRFDDDGKAARNRVYRTILEKYPKSREASLARLELGE